MVKINQEEYLRFLEEEVCEIWGGGFLFFQLNFLLIFGARVLLSNYLADSWLQTHNRLKFFWLAGLVDECYVRIWYNLCEIRWFSFPSTIPIPMPTHPRL